MMMLSVEEVPLSPCYLQDFVKTLHSMKCYCTTDAARFGGKLCTGTAGVLPDQVTGCPTLQPHLSRLHLNNLYHTTNKFICCIYRLAVNKPTNVIGSNLIQTVTNN